MKLTSQKVFKSWENELKYFNTNFICERSKNKSILIMGY